MGSCCPLPSALLGGLLGGVSSKTRAEDWKVVFPAVAKSARSSVVSSSVKSITSGSRTQPVVSEKSTHSPVRKTKHSVTWDGNSQASTLEELILAIRHDADVTLVMEPWVSRLSLQEWNKVVNHVGNKHWTYAMKVFLVLKQRSQFLQSNTDRFGLNMLEAYTCVIGVLSKQGRTHEAGLLLGELQLAGVEPDTILYNAVLGAYAVQGLLEKVSEIMTTMETTGIQPDAVTYEKLILCHLNAEERQLRKAMETLVQATAKGLLISAKSYANVIDGCCSEGDAQGAGQTLVGMRSAGHVPQMKTWLKMMQLYGSKGDFVKSEELMAMLRADDVLPTANLYDNFLLAYCVADSRDQAFSVFREYKLEMKASLMAYNILIELCAKAGWGSEAMKLFSEASDANLRPNTVTYTTMINALTKCGMFKEVDDVWEKMIRNNIAPNIQTYTSLIHTFTVRGWTRKGDEIFSELKQSECKISVECYGAILCLYVRGGWYRSASATLREMESKGLEPDAAGYAALIAAYGDMSDEVAALSKTMEVSKLEFCRVLNDLLVPPASADSGNETAHSASRVKEAVDLLPQFAATRTSAENCSIHNAITDALWRRGLRKRARNVMLCVQNLFDWYVLPSFQQKKWVLNLKGLSIGAAQVAVLDWLEEAARQPKNVTVPEKMIIVVGRAATGQDVVEDVKNTSPRRKTVGGTMSAVVSSLRERGYPCVCRRPGELEAKTQDVMAWMSKEGHVVVL